MSCRRPAWSAACTTRLGPPVATPSPRSWCQAGRSSPRARSRPRRPAHHRLGIEPVGNRPGRGGDPRITHPVQCGHVGAQPASSARRSDVQRADSASISGPPPDSRPTSSAASVRHLIHQRLLRTPGGACRAGESCRASAPLHWPPHAARRRAGTPASASLQRRNLATSAAAARARPAAAGRFDLLQLGDPRGQVTNSTARIQCPRGSIKSNMCSSIAGLGHHGHCIINLQRASVTLPSGRHLNDPSREAEKEAGTSWCCGCQPPESR